jgi:regulator of protease activity HflC (stomatin/prohibitin superfamily)
MTNGFMKTAWKSAENENSRNSKQIKNKSNRYKLKKSEMAKRLSIFGGITLFVTLIIVVISSFSREAVNANEEGVFIKKPYFFGKGGVYEKPLTQGSEWRVFSTDFIKFVMSPEQYEEGFEDLVAKDNNLINTTAYLTLQIEAGRTPELLKKFGETWYRNNVQETFRKITRDKLCEYGMFELTTNRQVYAEINADIDKSLRLYFAERGLPVVIKSVVISRAQPSKGVLEEIDRTGVQMQAELTQSKRIKTEQTREEAEHARAKADKAYMKEMNLSPDQFISLRALEIEKEKLELLRNNSNVTVDAFLGYPNFYKVK